MKEIEKISISGIAFTLETDALEQLNGYLESLNNYYKNVAGNEEIVADVEERIAELLIERGARDRVVDSGDIQHIVAILGTPEELRDADGGKSTQANSVQDRVDLDGNIKKRLYRDLGNNVLGGVCAGLAKYANTSPIWIRIVLVVAVLFGSSVFFGHTLASILIIGYIVLWIAVPPAKTVAQRCSMDGIDPGLDGIRDYKWKKGNNMEHSGNRVLNALGRTICFIVGIVMLLSGIGGFICGIVFLFGIDIFTGISAYSLADYIMPGPGMLFFKIMAMGVWFIPCIALLYVGSMLCFNFKSPKWRPGLILFILWIVCIVSSISWGISKATPFINHYQNKICTSFDKHYDTLYVDFVKPQLSGSAKMYMNDSKYGEVDLYYVDKGENGSVIAYYPHFRIKRDRNYRLDNGEPCVPYVETEKTFFYGATLAEMAWDKGENDLCTIKDSLLTVYPKVLSKDKPFDGKLAWIELAIPRNTVVIMREPKTVEFIPRYEYDD